MWLMKPYPFSPTLSQSEKKFNKKLSAARVTVERAFGILKARWRCLLKRLDSRIENISAVIICCCTLHNICQISGDNYIDDDGILDQIIHQERQSRQRRQQNNRATRNAVALRDTLKNYINNNF